MPIHPPFRTCAGVLLLLVPSIGLAQAIGGPLTPLPAVPALAPERVELGRKLFNDPRLSSNASLACASCHRLDQGGADGQVRSLGVDGKPLPVNTPSVFNASLNFRQFWDGRAQTLEEQAHLVVQRGAGQSRLGGGRIGHEGWFRQLCVRSRSRGCRSGP